MADRWNVYWNGEVVGHMINPSVDMFEYYGDWQALPSAKAAEFLALLENGDDAEVEIFSGSTEKRLLGYVPFPPDDEISVKLKASNFK